MDFPKLNQTKPGRYFSFCANPKAASGTRWAKLYRLNFVCSQKSKQNRRRSATLFHSLPGHVALPQREKVLPASSERSVTLLLRGAQVVPSLLNANAAF